MTDKHIIDEVNVSECGHYWNGTCHAYVDNTGKFLLCLNNLNCYYKQLKRKEQECAKIKQALDEIEKIVKQTCSRRCTNDCLGTRKHCGYGQILNIINKIKE